MTIIEERQMREYYIIKIMKIAVGTMSEQKLEYLNEVLCELCIDAEIFPIEVQSLISEQPLSAEETLNDSINRASHAMQLISDVDAALGMEVGYHPDNNGNYEILCYATLIDKNGAKISCESHRLLLPDFHQRILKDNKYLSDYVRQYISENPDEISQEIGEDIRSRKPFISESIKNVFMEWKE